MEVEPSLTSLFAFQRKEEREGEVRGDEGRRKLGGEEEVGKEEGGDVVELED